MLIVEFGHCERFLLIREERCPYLVEGFAAMALEIIAVITAKDHSGVIRYGINDQASLRVDVFDTIEDNRLLHDICVNVAIEATQVHYGEFSLFSVLDVLQVLLHSFHITYMFGHAHCVVGLPVVIPIFVELIDPEGIPVQVNCEFRI